MKGNKIPQAFPFNELNQLAVLALASVISKPGHPNTEEIVAAIFQE